MDDAKVFVATPLGKSQMIHIGAVDFCAGVSRYPNVEWGHTATPSPESSRNTLVQLHLRDNPDTTHLLFIDSDVVPPPGLLERFLGLNADIVTALTPIFFNKHVVWNVAAPGSNKWWPLCMRLPEEPFETEKCGGGAMLIKREVFESIGWPYFHTEYQPADQHNKIIKTGEDVWFCQKAREKGYKIIADPQTQCEHYNQVGLLDMYNSVVAQIESQVSASKYGSHWPVLEKVVRHAGCGVIELGCGQSSTPMLHDLCDELGVTLDSYENNEDYAVMFEQLERKWHRLHVVENWGDVQSDGDGKLVFVDAAPIKSRVPLIRKFINADYLVVHDTECDYYGYEPLLSSFKYRFDFNGAVPATTVVSNKHDLEFMKE